MRYYNRIDCKALDVACQNLTAKEEELDEELFKIKEASKKIIAIILKACHVPIDDSTIFRIHLDYYTIKHDFFDDENVVIRYILSDYYARLKLKSHDYNNGFPKRFLFMDETDILSELEKDIAIRQVRLDKARELKKNEKEIRKAALNKLTADEKKILGIKREIVRNGRFRKIN